MKKIVFAVLLFPVVASADTIRMDEVEVEGNVHKPEVMFITDRADRVPERDGVQALKENFLRNIVRDGRTMAKSEAR
jgi:hypothetical protein